MAKKETKPQFNIIDPSIKFDPSSMKIVHCKNCGATWIDKKIPKVCVHCGAAKGSSGTIATASDDQAEAFGEEYQEKRARYLEEQEEENSEYDTSSEEDDMPDENDSSQESDSSNEEPDTSDYAPAHYVVDPSINWDPYSVQLLRCRNCGRIWLDKRVPRFCPECDAYKDSIVSPTEDEFNTFAEEYQEKRSLYLEYNASSDGERSADEDRPERVNEWDESQSASDEGYNQSSGDEDDVSGDTGDYSPIGFNPEELRESIPGKPPKIGKAVRKQLIDQSLQMIKERKWDVQRAGLPVDLFQSLPEDVNKQVDTYKSYTPLYTEMLLKMTVDMTLQKELRHPRKGRVYSISDIDAMLRELNIREDVWEQYYDVAGIEGY